MAEIELTREEAGGRLPRACMCCGAPATAEVMRTLPLRAPRVGGGVQPAEIYAIRTIIAVANLPRMRLRTSFCERHRYYWHLRFGLIFGGLAGLLLLIVVGIAVVVLSFDKAKPQSHWADGLLLLGVVVYLVAWLVPLVLLMRSTIRVRGSDSGVVILQNVGEEYVAAVQSRRNPSP